ncbi:hypothetical protein [Acinetobacter baumannii]|uniref:hypothetical protein n=1 Tax=Acinetobacter baumannii TaxID=470 RepID=UPI0012A7CEC1|nr:hypothetical protein [Acinetobacter baumannii]QEY03375.1 hypothetical protein ABCAM1_0846 [Acinetobacter baumannii]
MTWHPMVKVARELGICVNTFKKHYLNKYPPERVFGNRKEWKDSTLEVMKNDTTIGTTS